MATFNVIGYHDSFTQLYVCYCYDWNVVGAGSDRGQAVSRLADEMDRLVLSKRGITPFLLVRARRRLDIDSMFCSIFTDQLKPICQRKIAGRHKLDVYPISKEHVAHASDDHEQDIEGYLRDLAREQECQSVGDDGRVGIDERDIPF